MQPSEYQLRGYEVTQLREGMLKARIAINERDTEIALLHHLILWLVREADIGLERLPEDVVLAKALQQLLETASDAEGGN